MDLCAEVVRDLRFSFEDAAAACSTCSLAEDVVGLVLGLSAAMQDNIEEKNDGQDTLEYQMSYAWLRLHCSVWATCVSG